ncbi:MAG: biosynthetic-type acetolactate synthase large subunit [Firmicutes bacterium]|nr:biosynthetic-type acetolactate synthase large subunit [Bacillota bacterium]
MRDLAAMEATRQSIYTGGDAAIVGREPVVTGAEALIRSLQAEGVEVVFGYPGGAVLSIYDELYRSSLRHILTRHEQGAAHAADAYARATGKPGVCIATSGPGATNLVTGLATAYMDSVPVIAITGQVATFLVGKDAFQEADITGITMPITKHNYLVTDARELPRIIKEAFHVAATGRPGPVLIDIPRDVATAKVSYSHPDRVDLRTYKPTYIGHAKQISAAMEAIDKAERPLLYVGGGAVAAGAQNEIRLLAEKAGIPVTMTLMGLGAFPGEHPLFLGMLGMHGTAYANLAVSHCDLLIAVGARFDDRVTGAIGKFAPKARIIHIDIDPAEIGKNISPDIPIVGDARNVLLELLQRVSDKEHSEWMKQLDAWKNRHPLKSQHMWEQLLDDDGPIHPQVVIDQLYELSGGKAVVTTDVGQHQMWTAQFFHFQSPRQLITSGGLGTMGFGLPAAIGAQVGRPEELVICIAGDGSIQMNIQELATVVQEQLPIKIFIINNQYLGMVRQWQELFYEKRYSHTALNCSPDFVKLAEAYGIKGMRAKRQGELSAVLEAALNHPGPVVVDCSVVASENVFPMVPAGKGLDEMLGLGDE